MGAQLFEYLLYQGTILIETTTLKASGDAPACSAEDPQSRASYRAVSALSLLTERNTRVGLCAEMSHAFLCPLKHRMAIKGLGVHKAERMETQISNGFVLEL